MDTMTILKKRKNTQQVVFLQLALRRLSGLEADLLRAGEPMLSTRLSSLTTEIQIALENTELTNG